MDSHQESSAAAIAPSIAAVDAAAPSSSAPEQVGPQWRRPSYHRERAHIAGYVRPNIIQIIKDELQEIGGGLYRQFRRSIFGHFMDFGYDGVSCNATLHVYYPTSI